MDMYANALNASHPNKKSEAMMPQTFITVLALRDIVMASCLANLPNLGRFRQDKLLVL